MIYVEVYDDGFCGFGSTVQGIIMALLADTTKIRFEMFSVAH